MPELRRRTLAVLLLPVFLGGCAGLPWENILPQRALAALSLPETPKPVLAVDAWPRDEWWAAYGDAQLDRLMSQALAGSPNLAAAGARLAQARAAADLARGNAGPRLDADANAGYGRQSENYLMPRPPLGKGGEYVSQGQAMLNFGYELDLWGRQSALIEAARRQAEAAEYDLAAARLALTTGIARAYAQLAAGFESLDIVDATLEQRRRIAELTRLRTSAGLDTDLEIRQAETGVASLKAEKVQLETAIGVSRLQLAALAGAMPSAAAAIERPRLQAAPFTVPASLPLDLLARRPDIALQRARLAAAQAGVDAARAQFYPNVNLAAFIGFQAIGLGKLLNDGSLASNAGPAIHLPLFDAGRLRANYAGRTAEYAGAAADYDQAVLSAAEEAVEQLARAAALDREAAASGEALAAAEEAYRIAMLRYREGLSSFLNVLAAEGSLLNQRRAVADVEARRRDLQIALVRALGGGFAAPDNNDKSLIAQP